MNNNSISSLSKTEYLRRYGYILHLWNSPGSWRASLEDLETGKRSGFENLEQLFTYLMDLAEGKLEEQNTEKRHMNQSATSCGCSSTDSIKTK
jgi:hypothetical protein